jgi:hypothetical protein
MVFCLHCPDKKQVRCGFCQTTGPFAKENPVRFTIVGKEK